jgi:hypothetical protein
VKEVVGAHWLAAVRDTAAKFPGKPFSKGAATYRVDSAMTAQKTVQALEFYRNCITLNNQITTKFYNIAFTYRSITGYCSKLLVFLFLSKIQ